MKQKPRTRPRSVYIRSAAVLTACLGAIALLATAYWASEFRLSDPATADRAELLRWLVVRDLGTETPEIRSTLLRRLQEEAEGDLDPAALRTQLDASQHHRVWANILVLIETWYADKVDRYLVTPAAERPTCLDQTIAEVQAWKNLTSLQPAQDSTQEDTPSEVALLELFAKQVTIWKERASPQRRREIAEFDVALRGRWVLHALGLAPSKRP
jgi:hypothetical protein